MRERTRAGHHGTGPGAITPDGCAVDLYTRLPCGDEVEVIAAALPAESRVLELGSGVGRLTHPMLRRGLRVTAVDESPQMLAHVRGAATVCSPIETLELDERFDAVLLASFLVHAGDLRVREGMLRACRRHVTDEGCVLIQREGEDWHERVPREVRRGEGVLRVLSVEPAGPGVSSVHAEYVFPDARWTQTFLSRPLSQAAFTQVLADAGLAVDAYLTDDRTWVRAVPR